MCSEKTIYNYIDACLFEVRNIDLPQGISFDLLICPGNESCKFLQKKAKQPEYLSDVP
jgi:hypothetical protein